MLRARSLLGRGGVGTGDKANLNIVCSLCTACKRGARTDNNLYAEYITRNARLDESQAGIKIAGRNINKLTYTDDTTLMAERKELKSLLMKVKEVSEKVGLKFNIKKRKIIASGPFTSWQTMEKQWKLTDFIFLGSKITADGDCSHEIKRCLLLGEKKKLWPSSWVQSLSCVQLFVTPWTAARQASVHHLLLELAQTHVHCVSDAIQPSHPLLSPPPPAFSLSQHQGFFQMSQFFASGGQNIGVPVSVLPMTIHDWFPLGWTGWISLQSKGLSRVFSNTTVQKHQFFSVQFSL